MSTNYRRPNNSSQFAAGFRWIVIAAFVCAIGLSYVYVKIHLDLGGKEKKRLENRLGDLILQNNVMVAQIDDLTSPPALQRRLDEGFIKLVPITAQAIVRVRAADPTRWTSDGNRSLSDFHPVSHNITTKHR